MRLLASSFAIALSAAAFAAGTGSASAAQDQYCKQGPSAGYPGDCSFSTYAQCRATASGTNDGCGINPQAAYRQQRYGYQDNGYQGRAYRSY